MRRALKISAWVVGSVAGLAVLLVAALFVAGNTQPGRSMIERVTLKLTGGYVKLSGLGGSFPAHLTLERLELVDRGGVWLTADRISLSWSPWALIERRIAVEEAQAARVDMERTPLGEPSSGGGAVWIPHIDVAQFAIGEVHLGAQLAGRPATLSVRGGGRLHALDDALADVVARRIDGDGEYTVHFKLDPKRMDGTLEVHEPASGPLENILSVPGLGALSAKLEINGPREAEQIELALNAGELTARARGRVDLRNVSADLTYSLEAPAVSPRPDLRWQRVALEGRWRGAFTDPDAAGHLEVEKLILPGGTQIAALHADLAAGSGVITLKGSIEGLRIPGPAPSLLEQDPLKIDAAWRVKEAARPLALQAAHRLFSLQAQAVTAGDQSATLDLKLPNVAPFAALAGQDVRGEAAIKAQIHPRGSGLALDLDAGAGISGGTAAWIGLVGDRLALKASGALSDDSALDRPPTAQRARARARARAAARPDPPPVRASAELAVRARAGLPARPPLPLGSSRISRHAGICASPT